MPRNSAPRYCRICGGEITAKLRRSLCSDACQLAAKRAYDRTPRRLAYYRAYYLAHKAAKIGAGLARYHEKAARGPVRCNPDNMLTRKVARDWNVSADEARRMIAHVIAGGSFPP